MKAPRRKYAFVCVWAVILSGPLLWYFAQSPTSPELTIESVFSKLVDKTGLVSSKVQPQPPAPATAPSFSSIPTRTSAPVQDAPAQDAFFCEEAPARPSFRKALEAVNDAVNRDLNNCSLRKKRIELLRAYYTDTMPRANGTIGPQGEYDYWNETLPITGEMAAELACEDIEFVLRQQPQDAELWDQLLSLRWGKLPDSQYLKLCTSAMEKTGQIMPYIYTRAETYERLGRLSDMLADYTFAVTLQSKDPWSYMVRAKAYASHGMFLPAVADYDRVIAVNGASASVLVCRAACLDAAGQRLRALADCDQAIRCEKDNWKAHVLRMRICQETGRKVRKEDEAAGPQGKEIWEAWELGLRVTPTEAPGHS